jgi:hypothetical protein
MLSRTHCATIGKTAHVHLKDVASGDVTEALARKQ